MAPQSPEPIREFERDLREIREARGVALSEVQLATRIPLDVLDRFESGHLVSDPHYNEVYLRNLLKAYGTAIGLSPTAVLQHFEAAKAGTYAGQLRAHLGGELRGTKPAITPETPPAEVGGPAPDPRRTPQPTRAEQAAAEEPTPFDPPRAPPPAVAALRRAEPPSAAAPASRAEPKARVRGRQSVTSSTSGIDSAWALIVGGTLIATLLIGGALWLMLRPDRPEVEPGEPVAVAAEEPEHDAEAPPAEDLRIAGAPQLQLPIQVTVIAAGGPVGGADGFRVTEAPDVRRPYWIEHGEERTFTSDSLIILWGVGPTGADGIPPGVRLRLQGYTWDPPAGQTLRLDRRRAQAILDSLHRVQARRAP